MEALHAPIGRNKQQYKHKHNNLQATSYKENKLTPILRLINHQHSTSYETCFHYSKHCLIPVMDWVNSHLYTDI